MELVCLQWAFMSLITFYNQSICLSDIDSALLRGISLQSSLRCLAMFPVRVLPFAQIGMISNNILLVISMFEHLSMEYLLEHDKPNWISSAEFDGPQLPWPCWSGPICAIGGANTKNEQTLQRSIYYIENQSRGDGERDRSQRTRGPSFGMETR